MRGRRPADRVARSRSTLIIAAIREVDLCEECIAHTTGLRLTEVVLALAEMSDAVTIVTTEAPCARCDQRKTLYRVDAP